MCQNSTISLNFRSFPLRSALKVKANAVKKGREIRDLQAAHAAQYQKNKQPNPKMGRRPK